MSVGTVSAGIDGKKFSLFTFGPWSGDWSTTAGLDGQAAGLGGGTGSADIWSGGVLSLSTSTELSAGGWCLSGREMRGGPAW